MYESKIIILKGLRFFLSFVFCLIKSQLNRRYYFGLLWRRNQSHTQSIELIIKKIHFSAFYPSC